MDLVSGICSICRVDNKVLKPKDAESYIKCCNQAFFENHSSYLSQLEEIKKTLKVCLFCAFKIDLSNTFKEQYEKAVNRQMAIKKSMVECFICDAKDWSLVKTDADPNDLLNRLEVFMSSVLTPRAFKQCTMCMYCLYHFNIWYEVRTVIFNMLNQASPNVKHVVNGKCPASEQIETGRKRLRRNNSNTAETPAKKMKPSSSSNSKENLYSSMRNFLKERLNGFVPLNRQRNLKVKYIVSDRKILAEIPYVFIGQSSQIGNVNGNTQSVQKRRTASIIDISDSSCESKSLKRASNRKQNPNNSIEPKRQTRNSGKKDSEEKQKRLFSRRSKLNKTTNANGTNEDTISISSEEAPEPRVSPRKSRVATQASKVTAKEMSKRENKNGGKEGTASISSKKTPKPRLSPRSSAAAPASKPSTKKTGKKEISPVEPKMTSFFKIKFKTKKPRETSQATASLCYICDKVYDRQYEYKAHLLEHEKSDKIIINVTRFELPNHISAKEFLDAHSKKETLDKPAPSVSVDEQKRLLAKYVGDNALTVFENSDSDHETEKTVDKVMELLQSDEENSMNDQEIVTKGNNEESSAVEINTDNERNNTEVENEERSDENNLNDEAVKEAVGDEKKTADDVEQDNEVGEGEDENKEKSFRETVTEKNVEDNVEKITEENPAEEEEAAEDDVKSEEDENESNSTEEFCAKSTDELIDEDREEENEEQAAEEEDNEEQAVGEEESEEQAMGEEEEAQSSEEKADRVELLEKEKQVNGNQEMEKIEGTPGIISGEENEDVIGENMQTIEVYLNSELETKRKRSESSDEDSLTKTPAKKKVRFTGIFEEGESEEMNLSLLDSE